MSRALKTAIPPDFLMSVQSGTFKTKYRGVPMVKSPFDLVLYLQLMSREAPRTVFEIGSAFGGSALWFADMLTAHGREKARVISVDLKPPAAVRDPRVIFLKGDANALGDVLAPYLGLPKPWLVVEDSSHFFKESYAVLNFFDPHLKTGDTIVVEDGSLAFMPKEHYGIFESGPNRAVEQFLREHPEAYEIDTALCDHYGYNVTWNPNGWLRRR
jgi:cephalosporin hydroxylase